ncbi:adenylylsulfate kinase [Silvimonas terrae]|uniref:Adenylyl-sulfate kinase n=1 Tax=Silvimonas terrae TaxID=300266 RepID=A0A840RB67_9NEIS|nr:adenylyl-sulfate kinase [Silvimonas terrae]MBB5189582.1 adenylylsulfate kinase [Silvimonas terrae]
MFESENEHHRTTSKASTLWLTGLSGAGKTTLAEGLIAALEARGVPCVLLDGDIVRREAGNQLGFSREARAENVRQVANRCHTLNDRGIWAVVALISPYRQDRTKARDAIGESRWLEVYVSTPLVVCEARDPKHLYEKARAGLIQNFTGISDPYEPPMSPALRLDTSRKSVEECVFAMLGRIGMDMQTEEVP